MKICKRIISFLFCAVILFSAVFTPVANATNLIDLGAESVKDWLAGFSGQNTGVWNPVDPLLPP